MDTLVLSKILADVSYVRGVLEGLKSSKFEQCNQRLDQAISALMIEFEYDKMKEGSDNDGRDKIGKCSC